MLATVGSGAVVRVVCWASTWTARELTANVTAQASRQLTTGELALLATKLLAKAATVSK